MTDTMNRMVDRSLIAACLAVLLPGAADAQTLHERGYRPVDQTIEDVDPLQRSHRVIESGLRTTGGQSRLYQQIVPGQDPATQQRSDRLYYISQGFTASFDRTDYGVQVRTGRSFAAIPPNTVFHLAPPPAVGEPPHQPDSPYRIDGRADQPIQRTFAPSIHLPRGAPDNWDTYAATAAAQRRIVIEQLRAPAPAAAER